MASRIPTTANGQRRIERLRTHRTDAHLIDDAQNIIGGEYGVTVDELKSFRRSGPISTARHICMFVVRNLTNTSLPMLAAYFGCHHSTIINATNIITLLMTIDKSFCLEIKDLEQKVKNATSDKS